MAKKKKDKVPQPPKTPWTKYAIKILFVIFYPVLAPLFFIGWLIDEELFWVFILILFVGGLATSGIYIKMTEYTKYEKGKVMYLRYSNLPVVLSEDVHGHALGSDPDAHVILMVNGIPEVRTFDRDMISDKPWDEKITPATQPSDK